MELVKNFCCLRDRLNASDVSEIAVTTKTRVGWMKFLENVASWFMEESVC